MEFLVMFDVKNYSELRNRGVRVALLSSLSLVSVFMIYSSLTSSQDNQSFQVSTQLMNLANIVLFWTFVSIPICIYGIYLIFKAETANPARGRTRQLTPEYDLVVTPDTVISFLPYFGRAFAAPVDPSAGGIKFTSSNFDYGVKKAKRKGYEISIRPHDVTDIQALYLTVFDNGRANLRVSSLNRESISFNGYIKNRD